MYTYELMLSRTAEIPCDLPSILDNLRRYSQEHLIVAAYNAAGNFTGSVRVAQGTVNGIAFNIRDIFAAVFQLNAVSFELYHNHPSGNPKPSEADIDVTRKTFQLACEFLVKFRGHYIVTPGSKARWAINP